MPSKKGQKLFDNTDQYPQLKTTISNNTRGSATNFLVPKIKGQQCNTFFYMGIREWNMLPTQVKTCKTHSQFKKAVKSHFLS